MELKPIVVKSLKGSRDLFLKDLEALPEDAYGKSLGGTARTVADIVYEVNLVNDHVGLVIRSEKAFDWPEGWIKAPANLQTKDLVIESFKKSMEKIINTAESFSEAQLEEKFKTDEGETTRFERLRFITLHNWYHSGQLNFIQTLMGDDTWHWV